jgi:hypothetical protein
LNLLETDAELIAKLLLRHALLDAPQSDAVTHLDFGLPRRAGLVRFLR